MICFLQLKNKKLLYYLKDKNKIKTSPVSKNWTLFWGFFVGISKSKNHLMASWLKSLETVLEKVDSTAASLGKKAANAGEMRTFGLFLIT